MVFEKRLLRAEPNLKILGKLWRINWLYVALICLLAGVGYLALYSAAGGADYPYARPQMMRFAMGFIVRINTEGQMYMLPLQQCRKYWQV